MIKISPPWKVKLLGIVIGALFGISIRLLLGRDDRLGSVFFIFLLPVLIGILPMIFLSAKEMKLDLHSIWVPVWSILSYLFGLALLQLEDMFCLIIIGLPALMMGFVGGFVYRSVAVQLYDEKQEKEKRNQKGKLLSIILIPFVWMPIEEAITSPSAVFHVTSELQIQAPPELIWEQIIRVPAIHEAEYETGIFHALGIPRPIKATLDGEGIGGHRIGYFEGGLRFDERIHIWEPHQKVGFKIEVVPQSVRDRIFDRHVLKGKYFRFEDAVYELLPHADGSTTLRLRSGYRLQSKINFYGRIWGDWVLADFQDRLLAVIQNRCELLATSPHSITG